MTCEDYFDDPEKNAAHLETCTLCRALDENVGTLDIEPRPLSVGIDALPLATWEGAAHRTWPLVAAGAVSVLVTIAVLFVFINTLLFLLLRRAPRGIDV